MLFTILKVVLKMVPTGGGKKFCAL